MIHLNLTAEYVEDESDLENQSARVVITLNGTPALYLAPVRRPNFRAPDPDEVVLETVLDALKAIPGGGWSGAG